MADSPNTDPAAAVEGVASAAAKSLEELLAEAHAKIEEQREAWLRALAESENTRKRAQAEIAAARKYGAERLAQDLLAVADGLEAALAAPDASAAVLREGIELTAKLLRSAFERAGVTEIAPAVGDRFDPNVQQAMGSVESDAPANAVAALLQKGYRLHDRVLRPALVTVTRPKEPAPESAAVESPGSEPHPA